MVEKLYEVRDIFKDEFHEITDFITHDEGVYKGRTFDTLFSCGVKNERERCGGKGIEFFINSEIAIDRFEEELRKYLTERIDKGKCYTLVWRRSPELTSCMMEFPEEASEVSYKFNHDKRFMGWSVSCRLMLIDEGEPDHE